MADMCNIGHMILFLLLAAFATVIATVNTVLIARLARDWHTEKVTA